MEFCEKCGSLLFYFQEKSNLSNSLFHSERGVTKMYCKKCKSTAGFAGGAFKESVSHEKVGKGVSNDENIFADYDHPCKKCGHIGAQIIEVGALISDEDSLTMLKCGKCGFAERFGRKVT